MYRTINGGEYNAASLCERVREEGRDAAEVP